VVEQSCIYQELDGLDKMAEHLLAIQNEEVVACLRLLPPGERGARVRIGRVAVSSAWRKRGMARLMMQKAIEEARCNYPSSGISLNAQTYLQGFYRSLGFRLSGDEFLEDGIPHVLMELNQ
jgi:ElaA protein